MTFARKAVAATAVAVGALLTAPTSASAAPIATGFAGPLQIDIGSHGQIYVAQSFAGVVTKVRKDGHTQDLFAAPGVAGIASDGYNVTYAVTSDDPAHPAALLKRRLANGNTRTVANLYRYEKRNNPDAGQVYGFLNLSKHCASQVPAEIGGEPYNGLVDSHPYAIANAPDGGWYVADAGGNDVLHVTKAGRISVFGVLRPRKTTITAEAAAAVGLPDCTIGKVYAFEPVPTDVEVKPSGSLIVSLLPGGPEDASLGARGAVVRLAGDGDFTNLASGFLGATNVALAPGGRIYVAELFGNKISLLRNHHVTTVREVASPASIEYSNGKLYASVNVFANGRVISFRP
jgi:hypothetical protein